MKKTARLLLAALALLPAGLFGQETLAERQLRQLIEDEEEILNGSHRADGSYDEELLESRFQGLVHQYDAFIQEHDDFPVGYVAYGRVLERIGQRPAARAMYMKANQLDPNIPLVKNQLGNYLAEEEKFAQALPYYLAAIELAPAEPLYHYQLGNLLHQFRDGFLKEEIFTRAVLDEKMLQAFATAAKLAPGEDVFAYRHAEAFYDLAHPRWNDALAAWTQLEKKAAPGIEKQAIYLHQAKVLVEQGKTEAAENLLRKVDQPVLRGNKRELETKLTREKPVSQPRPRMDTNSHESTPHAVNTDRR